MIAVKFEGGKLSAARYTEIMTNWLKYFPAFMNRLWCQLAISYTLLAVCAMTLLIVMLYGINDYRDFHKTVTLDNVEKLIAGEKLIVAQAIRDADNAEWWGKARDNIHEKLMNMEYGTGSSIYRITSSSRPEVYIQVLDENDRILMLDPIRFPEEIEAQFTAQQKIFPAGGSVTRLEKNGPFWVDSPITDADNGNIGRLRVLYIANFSLRVQLQSILDFLLSTWNSVLLLCVPIGVACGLVAARYVTTQLQKMNEVTESWRQGDFNARIALPNDDVLTLHSQHLNDMAQDLEKYLSLKQDLAVNDERNRVARELHDTVKQKLFALGLQLATAKNKSAVTETADEHIREAETITHEAQQDLMEIITQLRPSGSGDASLYEHLSMIADDFRRRFGVSVEISHPDSPEPDMRAEHHVQRVVQEALMNAVRHGKASRIEIASKIDRDMILLTIDDNGTGFDPDRAATGFGITSMRDRMRQLPRGSFAIDSTIGVGTRITLLWDIGS